MSLRIRRLSVELSGRKILKEANLEVKDGEAVLIGGPSGAGKTTLLRASVGVIPEEIPGRTSGEVSPSPLKKFSFYITQEPWFSVITPYVWSEVLSFSNATWGDLERDLREFGLEKKEYQSTYTLSAGELQRLSLICSLRSGRRIMLLDEPTAHLDPENRRKVIKAVKRAKTRGLSFVIVDHSLHDWEGVCDRVFFLENGILREGSFQEYDKVLGRYEELSPPEMIGEVVCEVKVKEFSYEKGQSLLKDLEFEVRRGEILWVKGPSGAGKSTLLRLIAKGMNSSRIKIKRPRKTCYIPDNPLLYFSYPKPKYEARREVLEDFSLGHLADSPIMRLSVGERRRVAVASAISRKSDLILMDEPTIGIDPYAKFFLLKAIVKAAKRGVGIIIASHDSAVSSIANEVIEVGRSSL